MASYFIRLSISLHTRLETHTILKNFSKNNGTHLTPCRQFRKHGIFCGHASVIKAKYNRKVVGRSAQLHEISVVNPRYFHMSATAYNIKDPKEFKPKSAIVFTKITRLEYEKERHPNTDDSELKKLLEDGGVDYSALLHHHQIHKKNEERLLECLSKYSLNVEVCRKYNVSPTLLDNCDIVFSTGGDGTYLVAANKVHTRNIPVIGINTDPNKSEGHLCLPSRYSDCFEEAIEKLFTGKFKWAYRQRIRITLRGKSVFDTPKELHSKTNHPVPEYRFLDCLNESHPNSNQVSSIQERVLPVLALNEVFMGESLSARVSYLNISINHQAPLSVKSSGLIVSTGTGCTSWYYNVNKLTHQQVEDLFQVIAEQSKVEFDPHDGDLIDEVTQSFNNNLLLDPDKPIMAYTLRDFITKQLPGYGAMKPRGLASSVIVKSMCKDASLVVDGGLSFPFNDGTSAELEIDEKDALRTVTLFEE